MTLRSTLTALTLASAMLLPLAASAQDTARTYTRAELESVIKETLMKEPEIIIKAVEEFQKRQFSERDVKAREAIQAYKTSLFSDKDSPVMGAKKADVTMVEFFDYNCGYCKRTLPHVIKLLQEDKKLNVVFKEYPVLSPSSEVAARASLAMYYLQPDKYLDYHAALFQMGGRYDEQNIVSVAQSMGADAAKFKSTMQSERVSKQLDSTRDLVQRLGLSGVPVFIIGDQIIAGAASYEAMVHQINQTRESLKDKKS